MAVTGLCRCFGLWDTTYGFFFFTLFLRISYAYSWLLLRRFWGGFGANLRIFMVCLCFSTVFLNGFSVLFMGFSTVFYG